MSVDVHYSSLKMSGVVCVKRGPVVEAEKSLNTQLRMITLSEGSPYETLHDYIASAVAPYFKFVNMNLLKPKQYLIKLTK